MSRPAAELVTTVPDPDLGKSIGRAAVEAGLAACAQVDGPITSVYTWEGGIEEAAEWRVRLKTFLDLTPELEALVKSRHPYEVPEIVISNITALSGDYRAWMEEVIRR